MCVHTRPRLMSLTVAAGWTPTPSTRHATAAAGPARGGGRAAGAGDAPGWGGPVRPWALDGGADPGMGAEAQVAPGAGPRRREGLDLRLRGRAGEDREGHARLPRGREAG